MFVPKLGLIKPGQTYICSQLWAFYNENITLVYFVFMVDRSSALSLSVRFFRTFGFSSILVGFLSWPRGTHLIML